MGSDELARFLEIARRELAGCDVQLLEDHPDPATPEDVLLSPLPDGRCLVVDPGHEPRDRVELEERVKTLIDCFGGTLTGGVRGRLPVADMLWQELVDLAALLGAEDALVIDLDSPIVWASASGGTALDSRDAPAELDLPESSRQAITVLRARSDLDHRRQGGRSRAVIRLDALQLLLRGFADIYLLVVVFAGDFDELRAERATQLTLSRIEDLVLALPPLEPDPRSGGGAKVVSLHARRR